MVAPSLLWNIFTAVVFLGQLTLGTEPLFALISLSIFLLAPRVFNAYYRIGSIGAILFAATFAKLFFLSQIIKIAYAQPADSHLQAPFETVLVLLFGLFSFWGAAILLGPLVENRNGLVSIPQNPVFLLRLAFASIILAAFGISKREDLGYNVLEQVDFVEGQGHVLFLFIAQFLSLAISALTARRAILSNGQQYVDRWNASLVFMVMAYGLWLNLRSVMVGGAVALVATYLSYGGRVKGRELAALVVAGVLMQAVLFPFIDLQRSLPQGLSLSEYIGKSFDIASDLFDSVARDDRIGHLYDSYYSWDDRLYYGFPTGFLDRFTPNQLDESVSFVMNNGALGPGVLTDDLYQLAPNFVLSKFGLERMPPSTETLGISISGSYSFQNFGLFADVYGAIGSMAFIPVCGSILFIYLLVIHMMFGKIGRNYFLAYGVSIWLLDIADTGVAQLISELTIRSLFHTILFAGMVLLFRPRDTKPSHGPGSSSNHANQVP